MKATVTPLRIAPTIENSIVEAAYHHHFDRGTSDLVLLGGLRYTALDIELSASPIGETVKSDRSITDNFVGIRTQTPIGQHWTFSFQGTVGTGDSELPWTLQGLLLRRLNSGNQVIVGARLWNLEVTSPLAVRTQQTLRMDTRFGGLMVGYLWD